MHRSFCFLALACTVAACERSPETTSPTPPAGHSHSAARQQGPLSADVQRQLAELRQLTASFHDFGTAGDAGWGTQITGCFEDPQAGAMGFHYGNTALIDGTVDARQPELLLYEPRKNGELRFAAVEYIVPFGAWTAPDPPRLYGQSFHRNEAFGLWVLHVWHFRHNPSGIFTDWNPTVSCEFAAS